MGMIEEIMAAAVKIEAYFIEWLNLVMIMVHVGLGSAVIFGGRARFISPSYDPLVDFTFGYIWIWGVLIMISAFLMATPFRKINIVGLWIGMVWHITWCVAFVVAATRFPNTLTTAIPAYGGFALILLGLMLVKVLRRPDHHSWIPTSKSL